MIENEEDEDSIYQLSVKRKNIVIGDTKVLLTLLVLNSAIWEDTENM